MLFHRMSIVAYGILLVCYAPIYGVASGWVWGSDGFLKLYGAVDNAGSLIVYTLPGLVCEYSIMHLHYRSPILVVLVVPANNTDNGTMLMYSQILIRYFEAGTTISFIRLFKTLPFH